MSGPKARFLESTDFLPKTFDLKAIESKRKPDTKFCMLCEAEFTKMFPSNPIRHCKRCAKSVCDVCSKTKRQLSQQDSEKHRVCDECDTLMDNYLIKQNHEEVIAAQTEKIENMNNMIVELDN
jgi:ATP-dependent protease Clp ATPase subunit